MSKTTAARNVAANAIIVAYPCDLPRHHRWLEVQPKGFDPHRQFILALRFRGKDPRHIDAHFPIEAMHGGRPSRAPARRDSGRASEADAAPREAGSRPVNGEPADNALISRKSANRCGFRRG